MIRFPYGIADFRRIRAEGRVYVDRTAYIRDLEALGDVLVFLRPRRFGKSLWLQTLASYYDLRFQDRFEQLFGDLAIGRQPTPLAHRFFVLQWNFSVVDPSGGVEQIAGSLQQHVIDQAKAFALDYQQHLPYPVTTDGSPATVLSSLLSVVRQTPFKLYLLIDEYDNFINEVMVQDLDTYQALVGTDGPFKQLFKSVKNATEGQGLERIFVTGVSPVALNDLTSGFNSAEHISLSPRLAGLCGFLEKDIRDLLGRIAGERDLSDKTVEEAAETMRTWYNGYCFAEGGQELVYNPTNALYFLKHLYLEGKPPRQLYDENLRTDAGKLSFLARTSAGTGVIEQLTRGEESTVAIPRLIDSFSLDDLTTRIKKDRVAIVSLLYYMGLLTLAGDLPPRLRLPNLVVRKLFLDRLLEIFLPDVGDSSGARAIAMSFLQDGELAPLLAFFEDRLLPVLSNRDRGAAPSRPGLSGSGVNEMVIKTLFLSMLFDDTLYLSFSEPEIDRAYADLCLLVRPEMRQYSFFDLLFEFKLVRRTELGMKGRELTEIDEPALRRLPKVVAAFSQARSQAEQYHRALVRRIGEPPLELRSYVVVAVGLERMLGERVEIS